MAKLQNNENQSENVQQSEKIRSKLIRRALVMHTSAVKDLFRPSYHFVGPAGWMNDPNCPILYKNRYHIFFQHCSLKNKWSLPMTWGHAYSDDLLNWINCPPILIPIKNREEIAAFSGCCIEIDGIPTIFYTSVKSFPDIIFGTKVRIAQPQKEDLEKNELINWMILEERTIEKEQINQGIPIRHWRDPFVWKDLETGELNMILGGVNPETKRPLILLYGSENVINWRFKSILFEGEPNECMSYECPMYFNKDGKDVVIISVYRGVIYLVGKIRNNRFEAEYRGYLDHRNEHYATTKMNGTGERILLWSWLREGGKGKNWNGSFSIPREIIGIEQNRLIFEPIKEINALMESSIEHPARELEKDTLFTIYNSDSGRDLIEFTVAFRSQEKDAKKMEIRIIQKYPNRLKRKKSTIGALFDFVKKEIIIENITTKMNRIHDTDNISFKLFVDGSRIEIFIDKADSISISLRDIVKKYGVMVLICSFASLPLKIENIRQTSMKAMQYSFHSTYRA